VGSRQGHGRLAVNQLAAKNLHVRRGFDPNTHATWADANDGDRHLIANVDAFVDFAGKN
jgi:hypothetical protein